MLDIAGKTMNYPISGQDWMAFMAGSCSGTTEGTSPDYQGIVKTGIDVIGAGTMRPVFYS